MCNAYSFAWQTLSCQPSSFTSLCLRTMSSKFAHIFFSGLFLDDMVASGLTWLGNLYRFELHLDRLLLTHQQGFCLSPGLFRKIWVLSSPEFQVVFLILVLDARNLTCLQRLPNALYTNYYSLKHRSFW